MKQKWNPLTWRWNIAGKETTTGPLHILIVDHLPTTWEEWTIYIVQGALYSTMYVRDVEHNVFVKVWTTQVTVQEQADWLEEDETAVSFIKNKPILAEVAITGSYDSLEDKPSIPEVFDTVITFKKNGEIVWTISTNQDEASEIDFNIPTKTSDLENDVPFLTEEDLPEVPTKLSELENDTGFINKEVNNLTNYTKTIDLADVALSNDYEDLDNKPDIPTKLSDLENDTWFIDNTTNNLLNYRNKTNSYSKTQIDELLSWISSLRIEIVQQLPNPWQFGIIYLIETGTPGVYDQYILTDLPNTYAMIGSTSVDLTNYFNKTTDTTDNIIQWDTNLFMTEAEKINLSHQSWYNTGDETKTTILEKMWPASATNDWYLKKEDRRNFNDKVDYDDFIRVPILGWAININNPSTEVTTTGTVTINTGAMVRSGLVYLLRVNASTTTTIRLWTGVTNPAEVDLTVPGWYTKLFVMLATSATTLELQWYDLSSFVKITQLSQVAFSGSYNDLTNTPVIPVPEVPGNGRLTINYWGERLGSFRANDTNDTIINIPEPEIPSQEMFTTIWYLNWWEKATWTHWLGARPGIINIDLFASLPNDSLGRARTTRALATWTPDSFMQLWTILTFSDWNNAGFPSNLEDEDFPLTLTVTSTSIIVYAKVQSEYNKFRITAYL